MAKVKKVGPKGQKAKKDTIDQKVGRKLQELRGETRQSDFAQMVGLRPETLRGLELGEESAGVCQLQIILRKLGKQPEDYKKVFFGGKNPPKTYPSH